MTDVLARPANKAIYFFEEGSGDQRDLLGGKGAGLAEMTRAGLPVPPGFIITTEQCLEFYRIGRKFPDGLEDKLRASMRELEKRTGKGFGVAENPLLVSVRSGARVSMPGMMDTILNLGLNSSTVEGLAKLTDNERFAYDAYRRFITMFSSVVLEINKEHFDHLLDAAKAKLGVKTDPQLSAADWKALIPQYLDVVKREAKRDFPQDVMEQLDLAIGAVFNSWNSKRAIDYRAYNKMSDDWGTAVSVVSMVFGNMGDDSGTGVAFTREPNTGARELFGEYLRNAQGEDVVAGIRTPEKISDLQSSQPEVYAQFIAIAKQLETHYKDMQDLEFTVERGKLYMLQTRSGKRSAEAAVKIALDFVHDGLITKEEAIMRVEPRQLEALFFARIDPDVKYAKAGTGLNASPGAATGQVVFDADTAAEWGKQGKAVILVRNETAPDDVHGMIAAKGVLTCKGGATSHAAVVARGMGLPCVCGFEEMVIDPRAKTATIGESVLKEGDWLTIDGTTGNVVIGKLDLIPPPSEQPAWLAEFLGWADEIKRLMVWGNADTPEDSRKARDLGATGIGLCRTEHMFMQQNRLPIVQDMILAETPEAKAAALAKLLVFQKEDFLGILEAMAGYPVTVRLLDPPLHEFLPSLESLVEETTELHLTKGEADPGYIAKMKILARVRQLSEVNPMLGLRMCRLGIVSPEIYAMQVRALFEAACELRKRGVDALPDVMIPGVGTAQEMRITYDAAKTVADAVIAETGVPVPYRIGTMIELPRACVVADELAEIAQFFSFGTNDLTQTTFGYSRDDADTTFIPTYIEKKILKESPFQVLDRQGVGELMKMGIAKGRGTNAGLKIGICGEHGGDPSSVMFCDELGLDYVSCSPYRVPIARLAAAQARVKAGKSGSSMSGHADFPGSDVRAKLDHPVVDADGHVIEAEWLLDEYVRDVAGAEIHQRWLNRPAPYGPTKMIWWGYPSAAHTRDRAMSMFPKYFAARMEECGIDFAHMLTTAGLATLYIRDDELRAAGCRALNTMYADMFREVGDKIRPVAVIPTYTPQEAIRELEYAVLELGHKAVMVGTEIRKPYPEVFKEAPQFGQFAERWQSIAIDPPHDYDPFWQRCVELGVAPICHTSHIGAQHRRSSSNYVFNHLGMFAGGSEHFCRALFLGGVTKRFPTLNFGLLEGGVAWAVTLLNDIVEHFEKRNVTDLVENLDPAKLDVDLLAQLADQYGNERLNGAGIRKQPHSRSSSPNRPDIFDEFAACGMTEIRDLRALFTDNFYFGCEADDRMMSVGFNRKLSPVGAPLKAVFGSDIGHWDVMDARSILSEAYGLYDAGMITLDDFEALTWRNPVSLHMGMNPDYFKDTVIESEAEKLKAKLPARSSLAVSS